MRAPLAKIQNFGTLYLRNPVLFGAKNFTEFFLSIDLLYKKNLGRLEHFYAKVFDLAWFTPYDNFQPLGRLSDLSTYVLDCKMKGSRFEP